MTASSGDKTISIRANTQVADAAGIKKAPIRLTANGGIITRFRRQGRPRQ